MLRIAAPQGAGAGIKGEVPLGQAAAVGCNPTSSRCAGQWQTGAGSNLHKEEAIPGPDLPLRTGGSKSKSGHPSQLQSVSASPRLQTLPHAEALGVRSHRAMCTNTRAHVALLLKR